MPKFNYNNFVKSVEAMSENKLAYEYIAITCKAKQRMSIVGQEIQKRFIKTHLTQSQMKKLV